MAGLLAASEGVLGASAARLDEAEGALMAARAAASARARERGAALEVELEAQRVRIEAEARRVGLGGHNK